MKHIQNFFEKNGFLLLIVLLSFIALKPLFHSGFFPVHDDIQVQRVYEMGKSLSDGMFPVRWVSDLGFGYGYPIFNFYAPLAYYFGGFLVLLGIDPLVSTKLMMAVGILLAGFTMYFLAKEFWGKQGGFIAAIFYIYAPYHALDIYVRGDVGEFWAYAFVPLAFYGLYMTSKTSRFVWVVMGALGFAGIILSHNLTALMVTPFLSLTGLFLALIALRKRRYKQIGYLALIFVVGISFSAFYWLPALSEMKYTRISTLVGGESDYHDHFVCPLQLWTSSWGYGGSAPGCNDGISFKIGKLRILFSLFALVSFCILCFVKKRKLSLDEFIKSISVFIATIYLFFATYLTLSSSHIIWEAIKPMEFLQFPWRFLSPVSFFSSFLVGGSYWIMTRYIPFLKLKKVSVFLLGFIILTLLLLYGKIFVPVSYVSFQTEHYTSPYVMRWLASKISYEYMPPSFRAGSNSDLLVKQSKILIANAENLTINQKTQKSIIRADFKKKQSIIFHTAYYPSWHFFLDSKEVIPKRIGNDYILPVTPGNHTIVMSYKRTSIQLIADIISLCSILSIILGILIKKKWNFANV